MPDAHAITAAAPMASRMYLLSGDKVVFRSESVIKHTSSVLVAEGL